MKKRVMILGFDSLDPGIIKSNLHNLPVMNDILSNGTMIPVKSVIPPDSTPAWATIYTGMNPGRHGLNMAFDIFESDWPKFMQVDLSRIRGKTFWDHASNEGRQVCILFPHLAFPPWQVNGIMVSRSPVPLEEGPGVLSEPKEFVDSYDLKKYGPISGGHPGVTGLADWINALDDRMSHEAEAFLRIADEEKWDLFFAFFPWTDVAQHYAWRFFDKNDPTYENRPEIREAFLSVYKTADRIAGKFRHLNEDSILIVISDHGHMQRPALSYNLNLDLQSMGYVSIKRERMIRSTFERNLRNVVLQVAGKLNLLDRVAKIAKLPGISDRSKEIYLASGDIQKDQSISFLTTFLGVKTSSYGGIMINRELLPRIEETSNIVSSIIQDLQHLKCEENKRPLFEWIKRSDAIMSGEYVRDYPDIIFKLSEGLGVGWSTSGPRLSKAHDHYLSSGTHSESSLFLISKNIILDGIREHSLESIAPTIERLLELRMNNQFDGPPLIDKERVRTP